MKIQIPLSTALALLLLLVAGPQVRGQLFTRVPTGPVVNDPNGSRSCNFLDINNDDYQDLLITNGTTGGENNLLYRNNRDGTFTLLTDTVCRDHSPSDGATCADYDNDGLADIFVVNWYNVDNLLYHNNGGGSYSRIDTGVVPNGQGYSETAAWGDMDNDGLVDLYVTNSAGTNRNFLYRNLGGGAFQKLSAMLPVTDAFKSRCVNWIDVDGDGDQDLFVTNENAQRNNLYRNDGGSTFTKITADPLVLDFRTSHSASWADYDNDGDFDVIVANYEHLNQLFANDGTGQFTPVAAPWAPDSSCAFSSSWADYDNDGDLDLFVTNGYCRPFLKNFLYENNGNGTFSRNLSEPMAVDSGASYGCAWGDYDNDGFMDLLVANWKNETQTNALYHNEGNANHWFELRLRGTVSNRSAIGAVVRCKAVINGNPVWQMREVSSQTGYCSQNSLVQHFGLGDAVDIDSLQVRWPSGIVQEFGHLPANHLYSLDENGGITLVGLPDPPRPDQRLRVYPNPSEGDFMIEWGAAVTGPVRLELLDALGRVVWASVSGPAVRNLRTGMAGRWPAGIYLLRVSSPEGPDRVERVVIDW